MLGLSVAILWFLIQLGLAYIVGSIIHFLAEKILACFMIRHRPVSWRTRISAIAYPWLWPSLAYSGSGLAEQLRICIGKYRRMKRTSSYGDIFMLR